jgi:hypothetical protein
MTHWVFGSPCPRFEVRLRKRLVDSSGYLPARSFARMERKDNASTSAPALIKISISQGLLSVARMPLTTKPRCARSQGW